jgi:hypothetical protein
LARVPKEIVRTEYIDVTADEVKAVIEGIAKAVDGMVHDFGFSMSVMNDIAKLMHKSPPDLEMVRIMLDKFFDVHIPDPDEENEEAE